MDHTDNGLNFTVPLSCHFYQSHFTDLENLTACLVIPEMIFQSLVNHLPVLLNLHIDKIDDDDPSDIPKLELIDYFLGSLEVGPEVVFS